MTNGEKYKTDEERFVNFDKFCKEQRFCLSCKYRDELLEVKCYSKWLEKEAEEELLPCPFCGGESKLNSSVESWVECSVCHSRTDMSACDLGAIEKWNRRSK